MRYIDAGYISALSVLAAYALLLVGRRRHLERVVGDDGAARPEVLERPEP